MGQHLCMFFAYQSISGLHHILPWVFCQLLFFFLIVKYLKMYISYILNQKDDSIIISVLCHMTKIGKKSFVLKIIYLIHNNKWPGWYIRPFWSRSISRVFWPVDVTCNIYCSRRHCELFCFPQSILNTSEYFDFHWNLYFLHKKLGSYGTKVVLK